uniref:Uncharacterized protein n=1 Tax=Timema cristinae TaxID=61476 RepID=A0A7R9D2Y7_TIMCR|nr:unnamed protein product [Timema cristinae]
MFVTRTNMSGKGFRGMCGYLEEGEEQEGRGNQQPIREHLILVVHIATEIKEWEGDKRLSADSHSTPSYGPKLHTAVAASRDRETSARIVPALFGYIRLVKINSLPRTGIRDFQTVNGVLTVRTPSEEMYHIDECSSPMHRPGPLVAPDWRDGEIDILQHIEQCSCTCNHMGYGNFMDFQIRDHKDVETFCQWMLKHNPFNQESGELINIASGLAADYIITCDHMIEKGMDSLAPKEVKDFSTDHRKDKITPLTLRSSGIAINNETNTDHWFLSQRHPYLTKPPDFVQLQSKETLFNIPRQRAVVGEICEVLLFIHAAPECDDVIQQTILYPNSKGSVPEFAWTESGKEFMRTTLSTPNRDRTLIFQFSGVCSIARLVSPKWTTCLAELPDIAPPVSFLHGQNSSICFNGRMVQCQTNQQQTDSSSSGSSKRNGSVENKDRFLDDWEALCLIPALTQQVKKQSCPNKDINNGPWSKLGSASST